LLELPLELVSLDEPDDDRLLFVEDESVLLGVDDAELDVLPVPLAPMLDVLLLSELETVLFELEEVLGVDEDVVPLAPIVALLSPAWALVASGALEALVPVPPDAPPVCAMAMPPTARAAAAARVVRVFLVLMSCSLNGLTPKGDWVERQSRRVGRLEQDYFWEAVRKVSVNRHSL
jgi:hypothetical protein